MKNLFILLLTVACGIAILVNNAQAADEPLPPEVKNLIGMKIPPKVVGREPAHIPKFILFSGSLLGRQIGHATSRAELAYEEGIIEEKWPVFFVITFHNDKTIEILDAHLLPGMLLNWRYKKGEITRLEAGDFLIFSPYCQYEKNEDRIIFGLEDPNFEHDGYSTRIERAWEVDPQSGHIKSIPTQGVTCAILGE